MLSLNLVLWNPWTAILLEQGWKMEKFEKKLPQFFWMIFHDAFRKMLFCQLAHHGWASAQYLKPKYRMVGTQWERLQLTTVAALSSIQFQTSKNSTLLHSSPLLFSILKSLNPIQQGHPSSNFHKYSSHSPFYGPSFHPICRYSLFCFAVFLWPIPLISSNLYWVFQICLQKPNAAKNLQVKFSPWNPELLGKMSEKGKTIPRIPQLPGDFYFSFLCFHWITSSHMLFTPLLQGKASFWHKSKHKHSCEDWNWEACDKTHNRGHPKTVKIVPRHRRREETTWEK